MRGLLEAFAERWHRSRWAVVADVLSVALLIAAFAYVGLTDLEQPGLYEDEAWSAIDAAVFVDSAPAQRAWPFMRSAYVGPLKTYLLIPVFAAVGPSVTALRATTASLGLASVLLLFAVCRIEFGRLAGLVAGLALALDLDFVLGARCDWGPIAFSIFAQTALLLLLLTWRRRPDSLILPAVAGLIIGLGLSHKFDFLAAAVAAPACFALIFGRSMRWRPVGYGVLVLTVVLGALPMVVFNLKTKGGTFREGAAMAEGRKQNFPPKLEDLRKLPSLIGGRYGAVRQMLEGRYVAEWQLGPSASSAGLDGRARLPEVVAMALLLAAALLFVPGAREVREPAMFLLLTWGVVTVFMAITPLAVGPHHTLLMYPFPHAALGVAAGLVGRVCSKARASIEMAARVAIILVTVLAVVVPSVLLQNSYKRLVRENGGRGYWSAEALAAIRALVEGQYKGRTVYILDWGFEQPLRLLGKGKLDLRAAFWPVVFGRSDTVLEHLGEEKRQVFLSHAKAFQTFPEVATRFADACRRARLTVIERKIVQKDGAHYASIYEVSNETSQ